MSIKFQSENKDRILIPRREMRFEISNLNKWQWKLYKIVSPLVSVNAMIILKVKFSLCLTKHHTMKKFWGSRCISLCISNLDTRWRWGASFNPRPLYKRGMPPIQIGQETGWTPEPVWTR